METETETIVELTAEQKQAAAAQATAEAKVKADAEAAEAAKTPEQRENESVYRRAKFLHSNKYGPDPDAQIIETEDGKDEHGRAKFKQWDFRKKEDGTLTDEETEAKEAADAAKVKADKEKVDAEAKKKGEKKRAEGRGQKSEKKSAVTEREDAVARAAATAAAETARALARDKTDKVSDQVGDEVETGGFKLPPREQRMLAVFHEMEKGDPTLKGLAGKQIAFWKKAAKYAEDWAKENPGKVFSPDGDEHRDFYEANEPVYDQDKFEETKIEIIAEAKALKKIEEREARTNGRISEIETKARMREEHPQVAQLADQSKVSMIAGALPDLVKEVAGEGELQLTEETIKKMEEADPVAFQILGETADELGWLVVELERLSRYPGAYRQNERQAIELPSTVEIDEHGKPVPGTGRKIYPHRMLVEFADELEELLTANPEDAARGQRAFMSNGDWAAEADRIGKLAKGQQGAAWKALQASHWHLQAEDIRRALVSRYAQQTQEKVAQVKKFLDLRDKKHGAAQAAAAGAGAGGEAAKTGVVKAPKQSVATTSASDKADAGARKPMTDEERLAAVQAAAF